MALAYRRTWWHLTYLLHTWLHQWYRRTSRPSLSFNGGVEIYLPFGRKRFLFLRLEAPKLRLEYEHCGTACSGHIHFVTPLGSINTSYRMFGKRDHFTHYTWWRLSWTHFSWEWENSLYGIDEGSSSGMIGFWGDFKEELDSHVQWEGRVIDNAIVVIPAMGPWERTRHRVKMTQTIQASTFRKLGFLKRVARGAYWEVDVIDPIQVRTGGQEGEAMYFTGKVFFEGRDIPVDAAPTLVMKAILDITRRERSQYVDTTGNSCQLPSAFYLHRDTGHGRCVPEESRPGGRCSGEVEREDPHAQQAKAAKPPKLPSVVSKPTLYGLRSQRGVLLTAWRSFRSTRRTDPKPDAILVAHLPVWPPARRRRLPRSIFSWSR